jgi:predicted dehydrogenase
MIKVLIVGQGGMGKVHATNFLAIPDVKIVGFVGDNQEVADEFNVPLYKTITEASNQIEIDVVDVCTPTFVHKDNVLEAFNNNKHVICEKPLALNSKDVKEILQASKDADRLLFVAHVVQFTQETEYLRKLVNEKTYGNVIDATFNRLSSIPKWVSPWMFDRKKAGLIPFDLHIHDLDLIVSLFGRPKNHRLYKSQGVSQFPEHFRFIYEYKDHNVLSEASWFNASYPFSATWRVVFEYAVVEFNGETVTVYSQEKEPDVLAFSPEIILDSKINVGETDMYYRELKHFIECIKSNEPSPLMREKQLVDVIEILEEIDKLY